MTDKTPEQKALDTIRAVYDDGVATINGRDYKFTKTTHKVRRKIFGFYTKIAPVMKANKEDFSWLDWSEFDAIEALLADIVTVDGSLLSKMPNHWDEHPGDYLTFLSTALPVVSYPFLDASPGGSTSQQQSQT